MPIVEVSKYDLERLTGLKYDEVAKLFEYIKCEKEDVGDRVRLEVTHDRPDHFSVEGIAKTIKGVAEVETGLPKITVSESSIELVAEPIEERPYISMAIVRGVYLDDEAIGQIIQLQEKLHETYGRGRRRVAIGFYDVSKIKPPIYYRRVLEDDEYIPLGFDKFIKIRDMYELTEQGKKYSGLINRSRPPALVDSAGQIMVIVPVLGSECCKITPNTKDVLIDVTGTDQRSVLNIMSVLIYSLLERSLEKKVEVVRGGLQYRHNYQFIKLDEETAVGLLGFRLSRGEFENLLKRARFDYTNGEVVVPPYRFNVLSWVDVVEDIAILKGYNYIPREPPLLPSIGRRHRDEIFIDEVRKILLSLGYVEVNNYILTDSFVEHICRPVYVVNPISELYTAVRCSLVPQLINTAAYMKKREVKIFEVGDVVAEGRTLKSVGALLSREGVTLTDGLALAKTLCKRLGLSCSFVTTTLKWALENRAAKIVGDVTGFLAEVSPDLLIRHGHYTPTVIVEFFYGKS
ncbi:MAG: phenylalanine--tRNA ligase subunit beta [Pyrobaculum sp.]